MKPVGVLDGAFDWEGEWDGCESEGGSARGSIRCMVEMLQLSWLVVKMFGSRGGDLRWANPVLDFDAERNVFWPAGWIEVVWAGRWKRNRGVCT